MATKQEVILRRERIKELHFVRKYSKTEIARTLNVSVKTVTRDLEILWTELREHMPILSPEDTVRVALYQINKLIQDFHQLLDRPDISARNRISAMRLVYELNTEAINLYERLGVFGRNRELEKEEKHMMIGMELAMARLREKELDREYETQKERPL